MDQILFSTPGNPVPENFKAGYFEGFDGRRLRYALFRNSGRNTKGTIVLLHGRNECIEKYFETIKYLTDQGFWIATFDWRGQGGSERVLKGPARGYVRKFEHYQADLEIFLEHIVLPDARIPFYALAHSMGGLVLLSSAPYIANRIDRIVLAAPFFGVQYSGLKSILLKSVLSVFNFLGLGRFAVPRGRQNDGERFQRLTADEDRYIRNQKIFEQFPEFETGPVTFRWLWVMFKAAKRATQQSFLERIKIPTIILAGSDDGIVPFEEFEAVSTRFRAGKIIPLFGARHEILQEIDIYREPALAATTSFFTSDLHAGDE